MNPADDGSNPSVAIICIIYVLHNANVCMYIYTTYAYACMRVRMCGMRVVGIVRQLLEFSEYSEFSDNSDSFEDCV